MALDRIKGEIHSIKQTTLEYMESFIDAVWEPGSFLPGEVLDMMEAVTLETGREVAVALDRKNRLISISIGDDRSVSLEENDLRRGDKRLCGTRLLHTHPNGSILPSEVDINSLKINRYDAMVVIAVTERETFKGINGASVTVLQRDESGELTLYEVIGPEPRRNFKNFNSLFDRIRDIDKDIQVTDKLQEEAEKVILAGVLDIRKDYGPSPLAELAELAESAGALVVGEVTQRRDAPDSKYYIGGGLAKDLCLQRQALEASTIIFDDELSPSQIRNLENVTGARVIDRTALILDIFAARAKSTEGRLQVELAQQKYRLPRLTGRGIELSRLGGGIGTRGPGESKLTTDKRHISRRIHYLEAALKEVTARRELMRKERTRKEVPTVALVGYTNVGKSTLLNTLCQADIYAEDKLFATLDTSVRKMITDEKRDYLMIDTVGFINKLPHDVVEAFKSTLEEALYADLLLVVVSADDSDPDGQLSIVEGILKQIGAENKPRYLVINKMDKAPEDFDFYPSGAYGRIFHVSARTGEGIPELKAGIVKYFTRTEMTFDILVPYTDGKMQAFVHDKCQVLSEEYMERGVHFTGRIPQELYYRLEAYQL